MTTDAGDKGARSLGEVHNEVRKEIRDADLRQLTTTLSRDLVYPLYALNTTHAVDIRRLPRLVFQTKEPGDITKITAAVVQLGAGMPVPLAWIRDQTGIPEPVGDEPVFTIASPEMTLPPPERPEKQAALSAQLPAPVTTGPRDELDDLGDSVSASVLQAAIDPVLEPVINAIKTKGLAEALSDLPALYQQMDDKKLMTLLTDAMFAAETKGMVDDLD